MPRHLGARPHARSSTSSLRTRLGARDQAPQARRSTSWAAVTSSRSCTASLPESPRWSSRTGSGPATSQAEESPIRAKLASFRARARARALTSCSAPHAPQAAEPPEPNRDLPPRSSRPVRGSGGERQLGSCGRMRAAIDLLMDAYRGPTRSAGCPSTACPTMPAVHRCCATTTTRAPATGGGCRSRSSVELFTGQQQQVQARFPATPIVALALLPTVMVPGRRPAVSVTSLIQRHRD